MDTSPLRHPSLGLRQNTTALKPHSRNTFPPFMDFSKKETVRCPLCQTASCRPRHRLGGWTIVQCDACRLLYVNPRLEKASLLKIYESNYFDNKEVGYYHYTENKALRKANFEKWVKDALPYLKTQKSPHALDVGCAAGYCLDVFHELGWEPFGIELDKGLAQTLRNKGFFIFDSPLTTLRTSETFRFISLFDVLEHLTDLPANMAMLHTLLEDDGVVVLVTPDYGSWQRKLFGNRWFQFKPIEHIHYFTVDTLTQLAEKSGFEVVHRKRSGQFCDVAFLENRLKKYGFGILLRPFRFLTRIMGLTNKHFYVDTASLYAVLKKKPA